MGIYTDIIANATSIDFTSPIGEHTTINREIRHLLDKGDVAYPSGFAAINEVQSIAQHVPTVSGGTFALTFTMKNGETFTTAAIVYNASAATIETAVDTAATGVVTGWTNGDISVSGGDLNTAAVVSTFDGASVAGLNHPALTIDGALLTGGGSAGVVSTTTEGQTIRTAMAILSVLGLFPTTVPVQGTALTPYTPAVLPTRVGDLISVATVRALALEAAIEDELASIETEILTAVKL